MSVDVFWPGTEYPCCPHCVSDGLNCREDDPGHTMACAHPECGQC